MNSEHPNRLYLDNAATSSPKPDAVLAAMTDYAQRLGGSPGRGTYYEARETGRLIDRCRRRLCTLFGGTHPDHVIFTLNCTDALNLAIKGIVRHALRAGASSAHIITTAFDHNSVLRPVNALIEHSGQRISQTRVDAECNTHRIDPSAIERALHAHTDTVLVAVNHASNVTGVIQPIGEIGAICKSFGVPLLVDAAQSLGHLPIDIEAMSIDLLAFPGHKGLLGPSGTGGLYIKPGLEQELDPLREGGTGSRSDEDTQPTTLPDRYEPGSPNAIGILGLSEGVQHLLDFAFNGITGIDAVRAHETALIERFVTEIESIEGLTLHGPRQAAARVAVFTVTIDGYTPHELSAILESQFAILTRSGIHCAPRAHEALGTTPLGGGGGGTRLSFGVFNTVDDATRAAGALREIAGAQVVAQV